MKHWIKALRSGKYAQGTEFLNLGNKLFCVLGVLCEIEKESLNLDVEHYNDNPQAPICYNGNWSFLPDDVVAKYPKLTREFQKTLIKMNDENVPFSKLADYIEKELT